MAPIDLPYFDLQSFDQVSIATSA